jgi:predicted RNA binding protein YcfA (HicA-like mRNA interferase family)
VKLPRNLSGEALVRALIRDWGYARVNQVGSHIILQTETPTHHRLSVPAHNPLRIGTLSAILRQVAQAKGVERDDIAASL